ncbi:MAG: GntR family transcriptional regulator [bacterium]|nr:GntR family transcriptional regulator [bacterium]
MRQIAGNLADQAYERLRGAISAGQLPPTLAIREADIAREYGMSRTPVREALLRLHSEGLIQQAAPGRYIAMALGPKELTDIYQVREALVGMAARLAAQHRTRVDLARFEDTLDALDRACEAKADEEADNQVRGFFHAIAQASGNEYLHEMLGRVTDLFRYRALAVSHPEWRDRLRHEHRSLVDAIASQDADLSERLARELIAKSLAIRIADLAKTEMRASSAS